LNAKNIVNTILIYPGVGHAFVNSSNYNQGGAPQAAWNQLVDFLEANLQKQK
jgi:dienelactone hydrolase